MAQKTLLSNCKMLGFRVSFSYIPKNEEEWQFNFTFSRTKTLTGAWLGFFKRYAQFSKSTLLLSKIFSMGLT